MSSGRIRKVVLLGAGNLSYHLGPALYRQGISILQVYNRNLQPAKRLARRIGADWTDRLDHLNLHADLYLIAITDSAIPEMATVLRLRDRLVAHTSGTVPMDALKPVSSRIGVFYPLQTFSRGRRTSFQNCPVCIESNTVEAEKGLLSLASVISGRTFRISSEQRKVIHLAAVFAGNFSNFMYAVAEDLLSKYGLPFSLLEPLIRQTAGNARYHGLFRYQTGPAVREDLEVIETHLSMLSGDSLSRELYDTISKSIIKYKKYHAEL